ncbi:MAG: GGDEF domain-containing protein, partial [Alloalcanivorax venustensis]
MHGRLATVTDRRQALRLRRLAFSLLMGGAAHTLVCWLILQWGFFRGGAAVFYPLFGTIWAGHLGLLLFARTGLNRRLKNPAMTEPVMIWCIVTLLASALYLDQGRLAVMAFFFAILHQGV